MFTLLMTDDDTAYLGPGSSDGSKAVADASTSAGARRFGIRFKFAIIIGAIVVALMVVDVFWNIDLQRKQSETEALEKAEILAAEMRAVWDFIDLNQDVINRDENGNFRTKTLVCVVAAKSVSTLFTANTDYSIRYTSQNPRQAANAPNEFEQRAFSAFEADQNLQAYYGVETDEGDKRVFRYTEPLKVTETCLECHGDPVGELDQYGYKKEGMQVGDIGGAVSIVEPMDIYESGMQTNVMQQVFMVLLVLMLACVGIYVGISLIVLKPLDKLRAATKRIGESDFSQPLEIHSFGGADELTEFSNDFERMARQFEVLYTDLESEIRAKTENLSDLNDLLIHQKAELKKAVDLLSEETAYKNEFFAIMSHELRTPLTSILAFARILRDDESLDKKTRKSVEEIEMNATLLLNMVNNILTISKTEAKKDALLLEPVDFVDLLGLVKNSLTPVARDKNISLFTKADANVPVAMADWEKLRRILENLVGNAIKYTHVGGTVEISVHFDGSDITIEVTDDGIGIAEEDMQAIFERYRQVGQSPNRRYRGTGLGLAVVKELTEMHGGSVSVISIRKQGSTFTVRIPYVPVSMEGYDEDTAR